MASLFLLDDDKDVTFILSTWLSRQGFTISHFYSSSALLSALGQQTPDIMLLDYLIMEQNMDGLRLCKKLKTELAFPGLVFILTAFRLAIEKVTESGADGLIEKPFDLNSITTLLSNAMAKVLNR